MKKLLLSSVALCGLAFAAPASAAEHDGGVHLKLGGFYKGYLTYVDQDTAPGVEERSLDWLQNTEVHFTGETTLDNGLTVGAHLEVEADNSDLFEVEESYAYFAGAWGRINAGAENGAVYLLQVAAPSADSNVDGLRQFIQPVNYGATLGVNFLGSSDSLDSGSLVFDVDGDGVASAGDILTGVDIATGEDTLINDLFVFDYDDDVSGYSNKITYLTPVFEGFQAGFSFAPENDEDRRGVNGVHTDDDAGEFGNTYELALRYAGEFEGFGFAFGGGFTHSELEEEGSLFFIDTDGNGVQNGAEVGAGERDDRQSWNLGLDVDAGAFGVGVAYVEDDLGFEDDADRETWVVGADYTNGPWKLGASYYNQDQELFGQDELDTDRYTGGVVYTYGPGMTFRGSISYIDHETDDLGDAEATSVLLGTQINF